MLTLFVKSIGIKTLLRKIFRLLLKNCVGTIRSGLAKGLKAKGHWRIFPWFRRLTPEELFLVNLNLKDQTVFDIGGHVGLLTMFFARSVGPHGNVIVFEPMPENYNAVLENVRLNQFTNTRVINIGLGRGHETKSLIVRLSDTATASMEEGIQKEILNEGNPIILKVEVDCLDHQIALHQLPEPDFVKIDVEGMEIEVLMGMAGTIKKNKPVLFIEIHGADLPRKNENARKVVDFLSQHGYSLYHVESKCRINRTNAQIAMRGHLYCYSPEPE